MSAPADAIAAVTHPDPYPYYAELVARRPLHRDEARGLWVAADAASVTAVLRSDLGRVRPAAEPVPRALVGSPAGDVFGLLVRMTDGPAQAHAKAAVEATLAAMDPARIAAAAAVWARRLAAEVAGAPGAGRVTDFAFRLPVHAVASLLGVPPAHLPRTAEWTRAFVGALAPATGPDEVEAGKAAAGHLVEQFQALLARPRLDAVVANTIGYLSQAYEATAGLIGNTLVALGREREAREAVAAEPARLAGVVREVVRHDPPVQNTRRFLAADGVLAGQAMRAGDTVLVVLAAANRDPALNPRPERFDPERRDRQALTFGVGRHACPGEALAIAVAEAGVGALLAAGVEPERLVGQVRYRPSANTRIPIL